jgi:hypothetical protein
MVEYSLDAFLDQITQGMSKTFYCHQKDVKISQEGARGPGREALGGASATAPSSSSP